MNALLPLDAADITDPQLTQALRLKHGCWTNPTRFKPWARRSPEAACAAHRTRSWAPTFRPGWSCLQMGRLRGRPPRPEKPQRGDVGFPQRRDLADGGGTLPHGAASPGARWRAPATALDAHGGEDCGVARTFPRIESAPASRLLLR